MHCSADRSITYATPSPTLFRTFRAARLRFMQSPRPSAVRPCRMSRHRRKLPVDVAAVRDLYGTLINEGANRGILITTSHYGPDAYAFARDKPISLLTGSDLVDMLRRHGRRYRIDLEEARRANK
jgi:restriction system protein